MNEVIQKILNVILPWRWWTAYWRHIEKITTSGYIAEPSPTMIAVVNAVFSFLRWILIGKVTVVNDQYLDTPGRIIVCANHSTYLDSLVCFPMMHRPVRALGAYEEMRRWLGIPALVLTKIGAIPVDRSHGATVLEPAIKVLVSGQPVGLFPEGKISPTGELLPLKPGVALIANAAYERLGGKETVAILPVHFCFGKRHPERAVHLWKMGLRWRGGITITIMPPIWLHEMEDRSVDNIMCKVRNALTSVKCATTSDLLKICGGKDA
ncbi:MAG TPA: lysophospholipid acyltransferase family protein [Candidatus Obscuribacterales bacterium]